MASNNPFNFSKWLQHEIINFGGNETGDDVELDALTVRTITRGPIYWATRLTMRRSRVCTGRTSHFKMSQASAYTAKGFLIGASGLPELVIIMELACTEWHSTTAQAWSAARCREI